MTADALTIGEILGDPALQLALRLALASLFAVAALHKARDLRGFAATLGNYRALPARLVPAVARLLVAIEVGLAAALCATPGSPRAPIAAVVLLGTYSAAISINLARGRRDIDCGCLGPRHRQPLSEWLLVRNAVAIAAAATLLVSVGRRPLQWLDAISSITALVAFALVWAAANQLMETWPRVRFVGSPRGIAASRRTGLAKAIHT